jgi:hypothetical protein
MGYPVTRTEESSHRKPGRPRKYGQGRINATVRFTPERHAELQKEADQHRRSFSEQIEYMIERAVSDRQLIADLRRERDEAADRAAADIRAVTAYGVEQMDRLRAMHAAELERMKAYALHEDRLADIIESAVARAFAKSRRLKGEQR